MNYNPLAIVHLHSPARRAGLGYQIHGDQNFHTLGVTWNAGTFRERRGVYSCFLGGWKHPEIVERPEVEIGRVALSEFETMMGEPARVLHVQRWARAIPAHDLSWKALEGMDLPDGVHLATNYTGSVGVNARIQKARALADRLVVGTV